jgi:hypothetical protein
MGIGVKGEEIKEIKEVKTETRLTVERKRKNFTQRHGEYRGHRGEGK